MGVRSVVQMRVDLQVLVHICSGDARLCCTPSFLQLQTQSECSLGNTALELVLKKLQVKQLSRTAWDLCQKLENNHILASYSGKNFEVQAISKTCHLYLGKHWGTMPRILVLMHSRVTTYSSCAFVWVVDEWGCTPGCHPPALGKKSPAPNSPFDSVPKLLPAHTTVAKKPNQAWCMSKPIFKRILLWEISTCTVL